MVRFAIAAICFGLVAGSLRAQSELPLVEDVEGKGLQAHVKTLIRGLEKQKAALPAETLAELRPLLDKEPTDTEAIKAIQKLLDAQCLIGVSINPESRVKAGRGPVRCRTA